MFWNYIFESFKQTNANEGWELGINIGDLTNCNSESNGALETIMYYVTIFTCMGFLFFKVKIYGYIFKDIFNVPLFFEKIGVCGQDGRISPQVILDVWRTCKSASKKSRSNRV